jgi:RNA polymerase sigma-70 factor, ECF subfamily
MAKTADASIPRIQHDAVSRLDEAVFGAFYRATSRPLWSYVYRVTGDAADADDIAQEAFLRLLRAGPPDADSWRPYLFRVASNLVADRWRKKARQQQRDQQFVVDATAIGAGATGVASSADGDLERTFGALNARERVLLWLAYVEGQSHEEIAASLGLGRRSIKVLLFRAKRRLRELLKSADVARTR